MSYAIEITRTFTFDAAHRLLNHGGRCRRLHGHRYTADVTVSAKALDEMGMVMDFGIIKGLLGEWIELHWDHSTILAEKDPLSDALRSLGEPHYIMSKGRTPTAENIALELFERAEHLLPLGVVVEQVSVQETEKCSADVFRARPVEVSR